MAINENKPTTKSQVIKTVLWNPKSLSFWEVKVDVKDVEFIKDFYDCVPTPIPISRPVEPSEELKERLKRI